MRDPRQACLRAAGWATLVIVLVAGWQVWRVSTGLAEARAHAKPLQDAIVRGDVGAAKVQLTEFNHGTTKAHHGSDGPGWWLVSKIPFVGRNFDAVRVVSREADAIADDAMPQIVSVADEVRLDTFRPRRGRVDVRAVERTVPVLRRAKRVFAQADTAVSAIPADRLLGSLRGPVSDLQRRLHQAAVGASSAADVASLMPAMLGADGTERHYLMLVLNNAEARSISGIPGSASVITAKNGRLAMGRQGSINDVGGFKDAKPVIAVRPELASGFLSTVGSDLRDTTIVPDYPRAAELAAAIVGRQWHEKFDGVVAVDPVALGYALGGLGPLGVGNGLVIDQTNAASTLMHEVYLRFPNAPQKQDDAFKFAARRSFDALTSGRGNSVATIRGLVQGVQERRIALWSRHAIEQQRIRTGGISGALSDVRAKPEVGVFMNDAGSFKMSYYLQSSGRLEATQCLDGDAQVLHVTATLESTAPQDARRLPIVVAGDGRYVRPGELRLHNMVVGPKGGRIVALTVDGQRAPVGASTYQGRPLARVARVLGPGETTVISADIVTPRGSAGQPILRMTPGAGPVDLSVGPSACR